MREAVRVAFALLTLSLPAMAGIATPASWTRSPSSPPAAPWPEALGRLAARGEEVRHGDEAILRVWPLGLDAPRHAPAEEDGIAHPDLAEGELAALAELVRPWSDARFQTIAAGRYLLRYARQPLLPDHEGTAPWRDFLLLVPLNAASSPEPLPFAPLLGAARRASGTGHPAVLALRPAESAADDRATLRIDADGAVVLDVSALGRPRGLVVSPADLR